MQTRVYRRTLKRPTAIILVAAALSLAGCQQKSAGLTDADTLTTASTAPLDLKETAALAKKWQADPKDIKKGMAYANALNSLGQGPKELEVLSVLHNAHPDNAQRLPRHIRAQHLRGRPTGPVSGSHVGITLRHSPRQR